MIARALAVLAVCAAVAGCNGCLEPVCNGAVIACTCSDGAAGIRVCDPEGRIRCHCLIPNDGGHGGGGGTTHNPFTASVVSPLPDASSRFASELATADLDGDGALDVVFPATEPPGTLVLGGNGDGSFTLRRFVPIAGNVVTARPAVFGDWNQDGVRDFAVPTFDQRCDLFLGLDGGAFADAGSIGLGLGPYSLESADVNGDGRGDLVLAAAQLRVHLWYGDGAGGFQGPQLLSTTGRATSVEARDLDRNGRLDLLVMSEFDPIIDAILADGDGGFRPPVSTMGAISVSGFTAEDVNGDQIPDLLYPDVDRRRIAVRLGTGDGTFSAAADFPSGTTPAEIRVIDWNRDGTLDLAVLNLGDGNVSLYLGLGSGSFARLSAPVFAGSEARSLIVGDFDGDGRPDLVVGSARPQVTTALNRGP